MPLQPFRNIATIAHPDFQTFLRELHKDNTQTFSGGAAADVCFPGMEGTGDKVTTLHFRVHGDAVARAEENSRLPAPSGNIFA